MNSSYETVRQRYRPGSIKVLLIAESPPPVATVASSRHFYRSETVRKDDRLFVNTIKALFPEAADMTEVQLEQGKEAWLRKFQARGWYMVEALKESQLHEITRKERQRRIHAHLPDLLKYISRLAGPNTKIILIKSNVFDVAAGPLRQAGFNVLNKELLDYPGQFNQRAYRQKLSALAANTKV